ncbi:hypothetical protein HOQ52_gp02 [uncultured phage_MedDCM-OCT-S30-C28]|uniref:Uncharacterized protein n=1 Tax=uncultured phage_MedDCM-OCT-S30-C28 TaxID=2741076 RepID=A0A6S4PDT1_9CAUD|nr:hypothetical protein HOQ52_gp02 [uncultured phage_MedDCM-OCT-S30-C28]BAQ94198.1 hypothetical protein [uncultured phage_MedDCM-OCT-S30-C28]
MLNKKKTKLTTKLSTKVIMIVAEAVCKVWKYGRSKYNGVSDFDYHITDLRRQYPNQTVYHYAVQELPFYCKTNEVDDEYERTSSIKIGDCNIRYTFDRLVKAIEVKQHNVEHLFGDPRVPMITDLITQTKVRHNEPKSLRVLNFERKETNVVKLHNK